jgi:uncharacterized protein involved in outer membrane biogenesis
MKKRLFQFAVVVVVLLVAAVVVVTFSLDRIIKAGVETVGPQVAKVQIKLDGVHLSLLSGAGDIKGLVVGNPDGFKTESAIKVGSVHVGVNPGSVLSDKIVIRSIRVEAPEITFEGGLKGNNLSKILANIDSTIGGSGGGTGAGTGGGSQKKLQVDEFVIAGGKINIAVPGLGGKSATVPLPDIHLTDLGKGGDGITAADLSKRVIGAILEGSTKAVGSVLGELGKGAAEAAASAGKTAVESAEKGIKGIGDLFKKKQ